MNKSVTLLAVVMALGIGAGTGYWLAGKKSSQGMAEMETSINADKPLFWRNPMNPAITSPVFMQDEMGMDYIAVYADGGDADEPAGTVSIDPVIVQNISVRTSMAESRELSRALNGLGRVVFNEERLARLHPKTSGWIEELRVDETGTQVNHDTILLSIYSPDLVAAQQEYLVALNNWETVRNSSATQMRKTAKTILESARERLQLFDVANHQIMELEQERKIKKHLHIHSPFQGKVMNIGAREGQFVSPKDELYLIADLTRIWVNVDVFEDELAWLKDGDRAEMRVRAQPGRTYKGKVSFIHPILNSKSRTVQVRLEFDNPDQSLKPGMFANVTLFTDPQPNAVVVPSEAIVRSGSREQVFVVRAPGKFEPREVTLGVTAEGLTQVLAGVQAGERVVTSSQFLIDSESKLREATAKMMSVMAGDSADDHAAMHDMDMSDMSMDESHGGASAAADWTSEAADMDMSEMSMDDNSGNISDMESMMPESKEVSHDH